MYNEKVMKEFKKPKNFGEMKNPDATGKVGNPVCLPAGAKVHANDEYANIEKLSEGQFVLGHDGLYNEIQRTIARDYSGKLIRIKNKLGITELTPEHEVLIVKVPKKREYEFARGRKTLPFAWYHADEVTKKDLAVYPIVSEERDKEYVEMSQEKKKWDFRSKNIPRKIPVNEDFLRLCGYYLSEGSIRDIVTKTHVGFTFNIKEKDLVEDVVAIVKMLFGLEVKTKEIEKRNTAQLTLNNVWVARLFKELFGKGAAEKKMPHWMLLLPVEKQKSLIYGLWKGDGCFNAKRPRAGYSTISYQMAQQIKSLLLRQEILPSIYSEKPKVSADGTKHKAAYRIHVGDRKSLENLAGILKLDFKTNMPVSVDSWFKDGKLFIPITETKEKEYSGKVYNLEIKDSKSYTTESLAVHNCGDVMEIFLKIGKNKKGEEIIKDVKIKTFGCVVAIANASVLTQLAKGRTIDEAEKLEKKDILKKLGDVPTVKIHCSLLAIDALKEAIKNYKENKGKRTENK